MKRVILYKDEIQVLASPDEAPPRVGERVELIRGDGPREGASMGFATIAHLGEDGSLSLHWTDPPK